MNFQQWMLELKLKPLLRALNINGLIGDLERYLAAHSKSSLSFSPDHFQGFSFKPPKSEYDGTKGILSFKQKKERIVGKRIMLPINHGCGAEDAFLIQKLWLLECLAS